MIAGHPISAAPIAGEDFPLPPFAPDQMHGLPGGHARVVSRARSENEVPRYVPLDLAILQAPVVPPAMDVPYLPRWRAPRPHYSVVEWAIQIGLFPANFTSKVGTALSFPGNLILGQPGTGAVIVYPCRYEVQWRMPRWPVKAAQAQHFDEPTEAGFKDVWNLTKHQDLQSTLPAWRARPLLPLPRCEEIDPQYLAISESITADKWYSPLDHPVWARRPLLPLPRFEVIEPRYLALAETTFPQAFDPEWPVPALRHPARRKDTHLFPCSTMELDERQRPEATFPEAFNQSWFDPSLRHPVRRQPRTLPWTIEMAEEYLESLFRPRQAVMFDQPMLEAGGFVAGF